MTLGIAYPTQGPLSTLASRLDIYTTDDIQALAFPGATNVNRCSTQLNAQSTTTLASITGLSQAVVPGNYRFSARLATSATGTAGGGVQAGFALSGGAVITSMDATGLAFTTAAVAGSHTTTTATGTALISSTTAAIYVTLDGTMVVGTGGTITLQFAQSASSVSTCAVLVGSSLEFTRLAN